ncbi:MAG TPA: hypothetical protein VI819_03825 [Patescibacteria group bacterium]|nr:hypothetical protein [Patescibacteria group bacterium]
MADGKDRKIFWNEYCKSYCRYSIDANDDELKIPDSAEVGSGIRLDCRYTGKRVLLTVQRATHGGRILGCNVSENECRKAVKDNKKAYTGVSFVPNHSYFPGKVTDQPSSEPISFYPGLFEKSSEEETTHDQARLNYEKLAKARKILHGKLGRYETVELENGDVVIRDSRNNTFRTYS